MLDKGILSRSEEISTLTKSVGSVMYTGRAYMPSRLESITCHSTTKFLTLVMHLVMASSMSAAAVSLAERFDS